MAIATATMDEDLLKAALETYELERMLEPDQHALSVAISAVLRKHEQTIIEQIASAAEAMAESLTAEEDPTFEGAGALKLFAEDLREGIPITGEYDPQDGDIASITLTGEVEVYAHECPHCGGDNPDLDTFSIYDRNTQEEFYFDKGAKYNIRLISRGIEEYL